MPRTSLYAIRLSSAEECELQRRAGKYTLPYFQVQRAKMILLAVPSTRKLRRSIKRARRICATIDCLCAVS